MKYQCHTCGQGCTNDLPSDTIVRACLTCPECIEANRVLFPEPWTTVPPSAPGDFIAVPTEKAKNGLLELKDLDSPWLVRVFLEERPVYGDCLYVLVAGEEGWHTVSDFTHWYALPRAPELP